MVLFEGDGGLDRLGAAIVIDFEGEGVLYNLGTGTVLVHTCTASPWLCPRGAHRLVANPFSAGLNCDCTGRSGAGFERTCT